jgi:DNA-nicking Smr family endonuclease
MEEFFQLAHEKVFKCVRMIHGKGIGVQRDLVRSILPRTEICLGLDRCTPRGWSLGRNDGKTGVEWLYCFLR